ncbi:hypothetical protein SVAN01_11367 [Stagonosporopsis vannaccii]|nr:hypothetical protein SVAN01_11367 [Stagonosporopsis vannaccii]
MLWWQYQTSAILKAPQQQYYIEERVILVVGENSPFFTLAPPQDHVRARPGLHAQPAKNRKTATLRSWNTVAARTLFVV